jgi:hypothetical protein
MNENNSTFSKWSEDDTAKLAEMRSKLADDFVGLPDNDVINDRRLLRFLGGSAGKVNKAVKAFRAHLKWRKDNDVDRIRHKILYEGYNHPYNFPVGKAIIDVFPMIVCALKNDYKGQPVVYEFYGFDPDTVLNTITMEQYLEFMIYSLEYRACILEQMSVAKEQEYLKHHPDPASWEQYGECLKTCTIRDLKAIGVQHISFKAKNLISASLDIAMPHYPEFLDKSHLVNVPWIFTSIWIFVKRWLDKNIQDKISFNGTDYIDILLEEIPFESIPEVVCGGYKGYNNSFSFDISKTGCFYSEGQPTEEKPFDGEIDYRTWVDKENISEIESNDGDKLSIDSENNTTTKLNSNNYIHVNNHSSDQNISMHVYPSDDNLATHVEKSLIENHNNILNRKNISGSDEIVANIDVIFESSSDIDSSDVDNDRDYNRKSPPYNGVVYWLKSPIIPVITLIFLMLSLNISADHDVLTFINNYKYSVLSFFVGLFVGIFVGIKYSLKKNKDNLKKRHSKDTKKRYF